MSTVLSQVQDKLQNTESSMNFMQAEHAQTLHGLHDEIHKLQTKCGGESSYMMFQAIIICQYIIMMFQAKYVSSFKMYVKLNICHVNF